MGHYRQIGSISRTLVGNKIVDHSLRCSWIITCRRCSNYIFTIDLLPGINGLGRDNCKSIRETFKWWDFGATYVRSLTVITTILLIYFRVALLIQGQSRNCSRASEKKTTLLKSSARCFFFYNAKYEQNPKACSRPSLNAAVRKHPGELVANQFKIWQMDGFVLILPKANEIYPELFTFDALAPRKCGTNFKSVVFERILRIKFMNLFCGNYLK